MESANYVDTEYTVNPHQSLWLSQILPEGARSIIPFQRDSFPELQFDSSSLAVLVSIQQVCFNTAFNLDCSVGLESEDVGSSSGPDTH